MFLVVISFIFLSSKKTGIFPAGLLKTELNRYLQKIVFPIPPNPVTTILVPSLAD
jgi:hypothetical protein